jgi:hydrogenase maturation protease
VDSRTLLVGIGSRHGDDSVGWRIARHVAAAMDERLVVRCARSPAELLDWLEGVDALHLCDGFVHGKTVGAIRCWDWPTPEIEQVVFRGSHDLSLPSALALAQQLGLLPRRVRIWGVAIAGARGSQADSAAVSAAVGEIAYRICGVLSDA